jgi:hypothetical protein
MKLKASIGFALVMALTALGTQAASARLPEPCVGQIRTVKLVKPGQRHTVPKALVLPGCVSTE